MNQTCDRCGPASERHTAWTGWGSFTCAGTAQPATGRRCLHKAGPSGPLASIRSRRSSLQA